VKDGEAIAMMGSGYVIMGNRTIGASSDDYRTIAQKALRIDRENRPVIGLMPVFTFDAIGKAKRGALNEGHL
jgi:hypothetical protein